MKLRLSAKRELLPGVVTFEFESPEGLKWQAGQYMQYTLPHPDEDDRGTQRWFTIAAPPFSGRPTITTRIAGEKGSSFKKALDALPVGAEVEAGDPEGDFVVTDLEAEYVFIAGGMGFTPFHAILAELDHSGTMPRITVLYGAREDRPLYQEELDGFAGKYPQLKIEYVHEPQRVDEEVIRAHVPDLAAPHFYVSGPEPMVEAFDDLLPQLGVPKEHIHGDYFPGYAWPPQN